MVPILIMEKKSQVQKFRQAAKEAGTDDSEQRFNATLKDLAKAARIGKDAEVPDEEMKPRCSKPAPRGRFRFLGYDPITSKASALLAGNRGALHLAYCGG
jgi:hypothetical protein